MTPERFSCVMVGEESLLVQCAEILRARGHAIRAVVTDQPPIESWAGEAKLPVIPPGPGLARALAALGGFDYLFSITNLRILEEAVLALPARGAINFHDGPLPRYAGLYTPVWALIHGEREYGITYHEIAPGIDTGDILVQKRFEVADAETSLTLNTKCYGAGIEGFAELVEAIETGRLTRHPQDPSLRSYHGKLDRPAAACVLDLEEDAATQARLIRALDFGRYANPVGSPKLAHADRAIGVQGVELLADEGAPAGTLLRVETDGLAVQARGGVLQLSRLSTLEGTELDGPSAAAHLGVGTGELLRGPSAEQRARLTEVNAQLARSEAGWVARLAELDPVEIPYLRSERVGGATASLGRRAVAIPESFRLTVAGAEPANAVLAAAAVHLARLGNQRKFDVALSAPELAAQRRGVEAYVAAQVPLRLDLADPALSARQGIERVSRELASRRRAGGFARDAPARFPALRSHPELREGRLLPVAFAVVDDVSAFEPEPGTSFAVVTSGDGLELVFDEPALDARDADALATQLATLLASIGQQPDAPLARLDLLTPRERRQLLQEWNATDRPLPAVQTVHEQFEAQVRRTPDAGALSCEGATYTYAELDGRANRLAAHLRERGVGPDGMVGVFLERSLDMVVGILGVMKAGGAYVPLDPAYPRDRIAFMLEDSGAGVVLTQSHLVSQLPAQGLRVVAVDADWPVIDEHPAEVVPSAAGPENLAYVIYTSGSTGKPKGVMVEHRNVVSFFVGMDERIAHDPPGVWLAVTSLSFDISVLELCWTLCRGFGVVLHVDRQRDAAAEGGPAAGPYRPLDFGIFLWGNDDGPGSQKYKLMLEAARFGDTHGFSSISTPERHFHAFGGPYPNPAVSGAAIAAVTERIQIRAGSCVVPLHHPVRVAEEWGVVDNLSDGRVGIAFASGWQPNDFVLQPDNYEDAKKRTFELADTVRRLWRGDEVPFENPLGETVEITSLPRPVQPELPFWITTAGNIETYKMAGAAGANVLTHLLGQGLDEVAEKVRAYREARAQAGFDPDTGVVTLMLHTFVGPDDDAVREVVRQPMKDYLRSAVSLVKNFAWAFPAFKRPASGRIDDVDLGSLSEEELDAILDHAFERYYRTSGLFGSPDTCVAMAERVKRAGIDEIACLIDYGVSTEAVMEALPLLDEVRRRVDTPPADTPVARPDAPAGDHSLAAEVERHGVTHMQCTPSMAKMMTVNEEMRAALGQIEHLLIGGEAFPVALAAELADCRAGGTVTNMYGPTETTIWSATEPVQGTPATIAIGRPIANTQLYVVDDNLEPLPVGAPGELLIGGRGVVRGYHERPELTAERFVTDPFRGDGCLYRTGDRARYLPDGRVEFLGRMDFQVKIRGYRIELGEIETRLGRLAGVRQAVVIAREDTPGDRRLVAYLTAEGTAPPVDALRAGLREGLPEFMVPSAFVFLDALPLTPNGKVDRKALPASESRSDRGKPQGPAPANELEQTIAEVWCSVLGVENVGRDTNFFDLGGHSLLVVQAHRMLKEKLPGTVSLTDLYRFTTLSSLAEHLSQGAGKSEGVKQAQSRAAKRREMLRRRRGA